MSEPITSTALAKWVVVGVLSILGGIAHTLTESRKGNITSFKDGFALMFISGFAGLMWGLLAFKFFGNDIITVAIASGMGGYASVEGLVLIINTFRRKYLK